MTKKGTPDESSNKLTKEEDSIARFVRFNCPTNTTIFDGNEVHYFSGKKAVDSLVESKKYGIKAKSPKFPEVVDAEDFLQLLLEKGLFFRAKKKVLKKKDKLEDPQKTSKSRDVSKSPKVSKAEKKEKEKATQQDEAETEEKEPAEEKAEQEEDKKKKKKIKLVFNEVQAFEIDTTDVYVWIFDPTPFWKKCVGILIVLGTIGGCLFPLWPEWLRLGVYYLSVTGIALFGLLLGIALARTILFALIWLFSLGRHYLWVLPNLTEDCGFFESFQPFYTYEYVPGGFFAKDESKKKKKDAEDTKNPSNEEEKQEKEPLLPKEEEEDDENANADANGSPAEAADQEHEQKLEAEVEKPTTGGSNTEEEEEIGEEESQSQSVTTDDSNSWDRISQNSQKSANGAKQQSSK